MSAFARLRVATTYWWRHGRFAELDRPKRFTEWVQWRKLHDRDPALAMLTDKLHSKAVAAERLGRDLAVPTVWCGIRLPPDPPAPLPLVVKANHGCNQFRIVRTLADWDDARRVAPGWLGQAYGSWLDEWHYQSARRTLLVEPFLGGPEAGLPLDYKVYVFGGRAEVVQLHVDRAAGHRWTQFDRSWHPLSRHPIDAPPPPHLAEMIDAAERLAGDQDFLRVDFYEVEGRLWFGEYCLYPGSGLDPFDPVELDDRLGACWSAVRRLAPFSVPAGRLRAA